MNIKWQEPYKNFDVRISDAGVVLLLTGGSDTTVANGVIMASCSTGTPHYFFSSLLCRILHQGKPTEITI